ncbi:hypothetical protein ACQ4PT_032183 [Festuca glaucescens]
MSGAPNLIVDDSADARLIRLGATSSFDAPTLFWPWVTGDGICGSLHAADPANACAPIKNNVGLDPGMAFVLIIRENCSFNRKVREAQLPVFDVAVVYDDEQMASLYSRVRGEGKTSGLSDQQEKAVPLWPLQAGHCQPREHRKLNEQMVVVSSCKETMGQGKDVSLWVKIIL